MDWRGTRANEIQSGQIIGAHAYRGQCDDESCPLHHPTPHALSFHPRWWDPAKEIMWRVCSCGVNHPDPDMMPEMTCECRCECCSLITEIMI